MPLDAARLDAPSTRARAFRRRSARALRTRRRLSCQSSTPIAAASAERLARERRRDPRLLERVHESARAAHRRERKSVRERLAERGEIWRHAGRPADSRRCARRNPVFISSKISAAPLASQSARARAIHSATACVRPPARSRSRRATSPASLTAASSAAMSSNGTASKSRFASVAARRRVVRAPVVPAEVSAADHDARARCTSRAMRTAALIASAPVFRNCTRSAHGTTLQNRSATSTSSTCESPDTMPVRDRVEHGARDLRFAHSRSRRSRAPSCSRRVRCRRSMTRQPTACVKCVGPPRRRCRRAPRGVCCPVEAPVGSTPRARVRHSRRRPARPPSRSRCPRRSDSESRPAARRSRASAAAGDGGVSLSLPTEESAKWHGGVRWARPTDGIQTAASGGQTVSFHAVALEKVGHLDDHRANERQLARVRARRET